MPKMRAVQVGAAGGELELVQREVPEPGSGEVLVKVEACGVCHGDAIVKDGTFPGIKYPRIPGHEVVGAIAKLGPGVTYFEPEARVGIGWRGGGGELPACRRGDARACENPLTTGISTDGGYAEYMVARADAVMRIPDELESVAGAPLLCAGRTTFSALKSSVAQAGDLVAIQGLGGLGDLALLQYAVKMGFRTVVLSRGTAKEELAMRLGAHRYIDTAASDPTKELKALGGAKVILCTAPNSKAISELIGGLGRGGQAVSSRRPGICCKSPPTC